MAADEDIRLGNVFIILILTVDVNNLSNHAGTLVEVACRLWRLLDGDANHDVGSHFSGDVCRVVVAQSAVNQHHVALPDGRERPWDGHAGAHGLGE